MSKKTRPQPAKVTNKKTSAAPKKSIVSSLVSSVISSPTSGGSKARSGGKRHHKKGAQWYAREIARLKLKKRYEKVRLRF